MPLQQTGPNSYELALGADDDDDGISISVVGEAHPRVKLSSAGVALGDGSSAPAVPAAFPDVSVEADGDYVLVATVVDNEASFAWVDAADYVNP